MCVCVCVCVFFFISFAILYCGLVSKSCLTFYDPMNCSTPGLPVLYLSPWVCSNSYPLSHWCHPAVSSSVIHISSCPQSFPSSGFFPMSELFASGSQLLELQYQSFQWIFRIDFLLGWLVWSPCCPRDSQESSPTPQFKSINSSVLSILYSPTLTSIHDYWKNHSFD